MTAVAAPLAEAIAANREDVAHYLELARQLYDQAIKLQRETAQIGGKSAMASVPPLEEAVARAYSLLNSGTSGGFEGVQYAHAYWQSLKHPWYDQIIRQNSEILAAKSRRASAEHSRLAEVAQKAARVFGISVEVDRLTVTAPGHPQAGWPAKIAASLEKILQTAGEESLPDLQQTINASVHLHPQERYLALESLRLRVEQIAKLRRQQEAVAHYEASRAALAAERIAEQLGRIRRRVESLEAEAAGNLDRECQEIAASLGGSGSAPALEDRVEALERKVIQEVRQQGLVEAAVAALRQQGYETVQVMQTIGPPEISSVYLQDPRDEGRVALLQVAVERGTLAAEVVRREDSDGSKREKQLDHEAQTRLCKAIEAMESALATKWKCSVVKRAEAGAVVPKIRKDLPVRARRMRVATALKSRSVS